MTGLENAGLGQSAADPECCAKRIFKRFRVACTDFFLVPAKKEMPEAVSVPRATLLLPMPDAQKKTTKNRQTDNFKREILQTKYPMCVVSRIVFILAPENARPNEFEIF